MVNIFNREWRGGQISVTGQDVEKAVCPCGNRDICARVHSKRTCSRFSGQETHVRAEGADDHPIEKSASLHVSEDFIEIVL